MQERVQFFGEGAANALDQVSAEALSQTTRAS
jgi:hypothetical protein